MKTNMRITKINKKDLELWVNDSQDIVAAWDVKEQKGFNKLTASLKAEFTNKQTWELSIKTAHILS